MIKDDETEENMEEKKENRKTISVLQKKDEEDPVEIYLESMENNA
jgi:hypothetical protein